MSKKDNISQKLFGSELNTTGNKAFMKQFSSYQKTKDIYQRAQQAMGRTKTYKVLNSSTIHVNISINATTTTF